MRIQKRILIRDSFASTVVDSDGANTPVARRSWHHVMIRDWHIHHTHISLTQTYRVRNISIARPSIIWLRETNCMTDDGTANIRNSFAESHILHLYCGKISPRAERERRNLICKSIGCCFNWLYRRLIVWTMNMTFLFPVSSAMRNARIQFTHWIVYVGDPIPSWAPTKIAYNN